MAAARFAFERLLTLPSRILGAARGGSKSVEITQAPFVRVDAFTERLAAKRARLDACEVSAGIASAIVVRRLTQSATPPTRAGRAAREHCSHRLRGTPGDDRMREAGHCLRYGSNSPRSPVSPASAWSLPQACRR